MLSVPPSPALAHRSEWRLIFAEDEDGRTGPGAEDEDGRIGTSRIRAHFCRLVDQREAQIAADRRARGFTRVKGVAAILAEDPREGPDDTWPTSRGIRGSPARTGASR